MSKNGNILITNEKKLKRPLSPHLTIYKPQFTSVLSIFHRITGIALLFSLLFSVFWVLSIAISKESYHVMKFIFSSIPFKIMIFLTIFAFWYHFCTGIRHLFYDIGKGFDHSFINFSAYIIIFCSSILSLFTLLLVIL